MKIISLKEIIPLFLILFIFIFAILFYSSPCAPDRFPTHWNVYGEVDGWAGKSFAVLFFPCLLVVVYFFMLFLPFFDPLKKNYQDFAAAYYTFRLAMLLFLAALYFFTLLVGVGLNLNIKLFIIPLISLFFITMGIILPKVKKNYFFGVRTPWTLHSEDVWNKTHQFSGRVFIFTGLLSFLTIFLGDFSFLGFFVLVGVGTLATIIYSYIVYKQLGLLEK